MGSCLLDLIASTWVDFYHAGTLYPVHLFWNRPSHTHACKKLAAFVSKRTLEQENERMRMAAVHKDLEGCHSKLSQRESELHERADQLAREAVAYKKGKNMCAAR